MKKGFTALCRCGRRRPMRKSDGRIGPHQCGRSDDCVGGSIIKGTEQCGECHKRRYDNVVGNPQTPVEPIRHRMDCSQTGDQP